MTLFESKLEPRYFERMAKALGDKMRIVENLPPVSEGVSPRVLDVGAGGGEFSHQLEELGYTVVALDASDDAILRMREKFPTLTTVKMLANEVGKLGAETFDAVVCSSILHEVFSYGDNEHSKGDLNSLKSALDSFYNILKPGGVLVIRDGVRPDNWRSVAKMKLFPAHYATPVYEYLNMSPFANGFIEGEMGNLIDLRPSPDGWWTGNLLSVFEFYMTYNWGIENYPREAQELYGVLTLDEYTEILALSGFNVTRAESWIQPGYLEHLPTKVTIATENGVNAWPDTNALWVATKL